MLYRFTGTVASDLEKIKSFLQDILRDMADCICNVDMMFDLRLILNELVINSAMHGNNFSNEKLIRLDIDINDDEVNITVEDEGDGIEFDVNSYRPEEMKCSGRGLVIVTKLSDKCLIQNNKVLVTKKII